MDQVRLSAPTIHCNACKANIEDALDELEGVNQTTVDVDGRVVTVEFDPAVVTGESIAAAVSAAGYPATIQS